MAIGTQNLWAQANFTTPLAYYPLSGGRAIDSSGNGNNGTLNFFGPNQSVLVSNDSSGQGSRATVFNIGSQGSVSLPNLTAFTNLGTGSFTLSAFFSSNNPGYKRIFSNAGADRTSPTASPGQGVTFGVDGNGKVSVRIGTANTLNFLDIITQQGFAESPLAGGKLKWHHAAVVVNRTINQLSIYVDGVPVAIEKAVASSAGTISANEKAFNIASIAADLNTAIGSTTAFLAAGNATSPFLEGFVGGLDEVRIHNRVLTNNEVRGLATSLLIYGRTVNASNQPIDKVCRATTASLRSFGIQSNPNTPYPNSTRWVTSWFAQPSGGTRLAIAPTFITGFLESPIIYYVQADSQGSTLSTQRVPVIVDLSGPMDVGKYKDYPVAFTNSAKQHWKFTNNFFEQVSNSPTLTLQGSSGANFTTNPCLEPNQALELTGNGPAVTLPNFNVPANNFSVSFLFRPATIGTTDQVLIDWRGPAGNTGFQLFLAAATNRIGVRVGPNQFLSNFPIAAGGNWNQLIYTYNNGLHVVYINGAVAQRVVQTILPAPTTNITFQRADLLIGSNPANTARYSGWMDELRIHDITLSQGVVNEVLNINECPINIQQPQTNVCWGLRDSVILFNGELNVFYQLVDIDRNQLLGRPVTGNGDRIVLYTDSIRINNQLRYAVLATDNSGSGCSRRLSKFFSIRPFNQIPKPVILTQGGTLICPGETTNLIAPGGYASYRWKNNGVVLPTTTRTLAVNASGNYDVQLTNAQGCISEVSNVMSVTLQNPPSTPIISTNPAVLNRVCDGTTVLITANPNQIGGIYEWRDPWTNQIIDTVTTAVFRTQSSVALQVRWKPSATACFSEFSPVSFIRLNKRPNDVGQYSGFRDSTYKGLQVFHTFTRRNQADLSSVPDSSGNQRNGRRNSGAGVGGSPVDSTDFCRIERQSIFLNSFNQDRVDLNYGGSDPSFTIQAQVRLNSLPSAVSFYTIFYKSQTFNGIPNNSLANYWLRVNNLGQIEFLFRSGNGAPTTLTSTFSLPALLWANIAVTYDGTRATLYVNGQPDATIAGPYTPNGQSITVGARRTNVAFFDQFWDGWVDNIRVYNRAISPLEAADLNTNPCVLQYKYDKVLCPYDSTNFVLVNSEPGVTYTLYNKRTNIPLGTGRYNNGSDATIKVRFGAPPAQDTAVNYYVIAVNDASLCSRRLTEEPRIKLAKIPDNLRVFARPNNLQGGVVQICNGSVAWLKVDKSKIGPKDQIVWVNSASTDSIRVTTPGQWFYKIITENGCEVTSQILTTDLTPLPLAPTLDTNGATLCQGDSMRIRAILSDPSVISFRWRRGNSLLPDTGRFLVVKQPGVYTASARTRFCIGPASTPATFQILERSSRPTYSVSGPLEFCEGDSIQVSAPDIPGAVYRWSNDSTQRQIWIKESIDTLSVVVTEPGKCPSPKSGSRTFRVIRRPDKPTVISPTGIFCSGDTLVFIAPPGFATYRWNTKRPEDTTRIIRIAAEPPSKNPIRVQVSLNGICFSDSSDGVPVAFLPAPTKPTITPQSTTDLCSGNPAQSVILVAAANPIGTGTVSYQWYRNGRSIPGANGANYTADTAGIYKVMAVIGDPATGCFKFSDSTIVNKFQRPPSEITILGDTAVCIGTPVYMSAPRGVGYTYQWRLNNSDIAGANFFAYTATQPGNYELILKANGCDSLSKARTIIYDGVVAPVISSEPFAPILLCEKDSARLRTDSLEGYFFQWYRNNTVLTADTFSSMIAKEPGVYTVRVRKGGCVRFSSGIDVSFKPVPKAKYTYYGNPQFCKGDTMVLKAQGQPGLSYKWFLDGREITGETDSFLIVSQEGIYHLVTEFDGCSSDSSERVLVTEQENPVASLNVNYTFRELCQGDFVRLQIKTTDIKPNQTYTWLRDGVVIPREVGEFYTVNTPGRYQLIVRINRCIDSSDTVRIMYRNPPKPRLGNDTVVCRSEGVARFVLRVTNPKALSYLWNDGTTADTIAVVDSGTYVVTITDSIGCVGSDTIKIGITECDPEVWIPTAFTPNNNNLNEEFVTQSYNVSKYEMRIYNRWGQMVFFGNDPSKHWNGQFEGANCPAGEYRYTCRYEGPVRGKVTIREKVGTVTVIR